MTTPDTLSERVKAEIALMDGDAAAWGVDTYSDRPRLLKVLDDVAEALPMHEDATEADFQRDICDYRPVYAAPPSPQSREGT